jgi:hypothetical protein
MGKTMRERRSTDKGIKKTKEIRNGHEESVLK